MKEIYALMAQMDEKGQDMTELFAGAVRLGVKIGLAEAAARQKQEENEKDAG